jgi:hypothetical protein
MNWNPGVYLNTTHNTQRVEEMLGMRLDRTALEANRRPCTGSVQTTPGGVPGVCEMRKALFTLERDLTGLKCPVQKANYNARCTPPTLCRGPRTVKRDTTAL